MRQNTCIRGTAIFLAVLLAGTTYITGCSNPNKAQQGAVIGGLGGAAVGSQLGHRNDRGRNALIGAGIGFLLGYAIGNEWDKHDQQQLGNTLEYNRTGTTREWVNPDTGSSYSATPTRTYRQNDRDYRDVEIDGCVDGRRETIHATAYRQPDGTWQLVQ